MTFKKPELGKPILLRIVAITDGVDGYNNPEWKFRGTTPDGEDVTTNMSEKSALRQLARHGLDRASAIGRTLEFGVTKQGVKKYYDINLPAGQEGLALPAERSAPTPRAAAPAPVFSNPADLDAMKARRKAIIAREKALLTYAMDGAQKMLAAYFAEQKFGTDAVSPDAWVQSIATLGGSLYIGLSARGLGE